MIGYQIPRMVVKGVSDARKVTVEGANNLSNKRKTHRWISGDMVIDVSDFWPDLMRLGCLPFAGERKETTFSMVVIKDVRVVDSRQNFAFDPCYSLQHSFLFLGASICSL